MFQYETAMFHLTQGGNRSCWSYRQETRGKVRGGDNERPGNTYVRLSGSDAARLGNVSAMRRLAGQQIWRRFDPLRLSFWLIATATALLIIGAATQG